MILPVKKNKYGERVADISLEKQYRQLFEEIMEANAEGANGMWRCYEAEELVDVMACCVTRLNILGVEDYAVTSWGAMVKDFYVELTDKALVAYGAALAANNAPQIGFTGTAGHKALYREEIETLREIMSMCIAKLESIGYDGNKRQEMYQYVNDKNKDRGYLDD